MLTILEIIVPISLTGWYTIRKDYLHFDEITYEPRYMKLIIFSLHHS